MINGKKNVCNRSLMGKNKLSRYADNARFSNVLEHNNLDNQSVLKGDWAAGIFGNSNPVILELACGKGEYTLHLARLFPDINFIGVDIKGARIWKGAKAALEEELQNIRFLRCYIGNLDRFFEQNEISDIWITFPDPHLKNRNAKKRLTSPKYLAIYRKVAAQDCKIHLKTDSRPLYLYTKSVITQQNLKIDQEYDNLYKQNPEDEILSHKTYYEKKHLAKGRTIRFISFSLFP